MKFRQLGSSVLLSLLAAATLAEASADEPLVSLDGSGRLLISSLSPVLTEDDVERHLDSGLTTSFLFQARSHQSSKPGAARVDIRFELWDEVYLVTVLDGEGQVEKSQHSSAEALRSWWSEVEIVLSMPAQKAESFGSRARVSLAVVPFSQAELDDTQKWLTESMAQAQGGSRGASEGGAARAVGALIATSMQRRAVRSTTWNVQIGRRGTP